MSDKENHVVFEEKQYLGYNKFNLSLRMVVAIFAFLAAYYAEPTDPNSELFLYTGVIVLLLSLGLVFVLHLHTKVDESSLHISGFWNSRIVKVNLDEIESCKPVKYSKFILNRPVYNLHLKGKVRFFTRGNDAVQLVDKDGLIYLIGTQRSKEMAEVVNQIIKKK